MPVTRPKTQRDQAKIEAEERAESRSALSNEEQIAALDARLGVGVGAARERARLGA